jgi:hypothetical protein
VRSTKGFLEYVDEASGSVAPLEYSLDPLARGTTDSGGFLRVRKDVRHGVGHGPGVAHGDEASRVSIRAHNLG